MEKDGRIIQINDIDINYNIKQLREKKFMIQSNVLAKLQIRKVQISVYSLSKIENDCQKPTISFLSTLTKILDCGNNAFFK